MASVQNIGINGERNKADNERTGTPRESSAHLMSRSQGRDSYWFAYGRTEDTPPANVESRSTAADQREREEKMRLFREQQEEQRLRKLRGLEQQFLVAKQHREQQEEERRRRIEEARLREIDRRQQVEERKRQIWEAEQERKEAILRRNMDREARIEARRNAHRNAQSFAFGSSTPRTFDLDLAAIGAGRTNAVLLASVGRRPEDPPPRATSACSLDRKFGEDSMSRSMVSLSSSSSMFRGRRRTDITPTPSRERSATPHATPRGNPSRAVSMTRLDQLAQPRRTYRGTTTATASAADMSKSMCNLAQGPAGPPTAPARGGGMRPAHSMQHLAAPPRLTRTARLRAQAASAWSLNRAESRCYLAPGGVKDGSPSRPQSSLSDASATSSSVSAVHLRPRPAPRRPRPYSVAGTIVQLPKKEPERHHRGHERSAPAPRAKSVSREAESAPRKPQPPPKSSELLSRTKPHPVANKDNLRKVNRPVGKPTEKPEEKDRPSEARNATDKIECKRKEETRQQEEAQLNSAVTSPTTDSEVLPLSSDDSKTATSVSQSVTEEEAVQRAVPGEGQEAVQRADPAENQKVIQRVDPAEGQKSIQKADPTEGQKAVHRADPTEGQKLIQKADPAENKKVIQRADPAESQEAVQRADPAEGSGTPKPRITSEEEARAALAEKRRIAREQAEREAELERMRLEEERRLEEEQRDREEQEQRRIAELHRQLEQEKLARAIEEQQQREREEQERREEEARQRVEKEEQEKKAREEAEKQRIELEEKLRKEEEERAERKKRVEQIMARTRGKTAAAQSPSEGRPVPAPRAIEVPNGAWPCKDPPPLPDILNAAIQSGQRNGAFTENGSAKQDLSPQSNGYSSHEDMSCTTSPEESPLIDLPPLVENVSNDNFLIRLDDEVNSNIFSSSGATGQVADLLS